MIIEITAEFSSIGLIYPGILLRDTFKQVKNIQLRGFSLNKINFENIAYPFCSRISAGPNIAMLVLLANVHRFHH